MMSIEPWEATPNKSLDAKTSGLVIRTSRMLLVVVARRVNSTRWVALLSPKHSLKVRV